MQPSPEIKLPGTWGRFTHWLSLHGTLARVVSLTGMVVFLAFLPAYIWVVFWNGLLSHKLLAVMLLIFNLLAISLVWSAGQQLDEWFFLYLNVRGQRPIWLDRMMLGFTQIGNGIFALVIALVIFLFSDRAFSYEFILGALTLWLVVEMVKFLTHRPRPFISLVQARIVGSRAVGRSFPSGHTSQVFFMATLLSQQFNHGLVSGAALYAVAVLVGLTRMYVGAHYPRDVIGGAVLGTVWGFLTILLDPYWIALRF